MCVSCEVRTGFIYVNWENVMLQGITRLRGEEFICLRSGRQGFATFILYIWGGGVIVRRCQELEYVA
jgi:hypothetical protein